MDIGTVKQISIEREMQGAYLDFAMSVITARALPDVRDGLKPVQRRILYVMHELGLHPNSAYKKSARIVGEVLGKYHPHGDAAVYETMVRLAQDFSMRYPLVDGQGNFGSVDGDPAAAMRYTEARLSPIAEELLADIDRDTVDFTANFDGSLKEPSVLPGKLPNLLVNGSSGIAVGMATNIPPHNLGEVIDAIASMIDSFSSVVADGVPFEIVWARALGNSIEPDVLAKIPRNAPKRLMARLKSIPGRTSSTEERTSTVLALIDELVDVTPDQLMQSIKGPDFPTGGIIVGTEGISNAYATGRGRITIRAKVHTEDIRGGRQQLVVTELPYQVNKSNLIEKIADLIRARRIEGIGDLRDESDREGMRIVVELRRDVSPQQVLNQLYRHTAMQTAFSANVLALVDGQPRVLTLKALLLQYINYRKAVVTRRTEHDLGRARHRAHILEGLKIALDNLDEVIATIRKSRDAETARGALMHRFKLSEIQAQAILDMQLRRLAALERRKILEELAEVRKLISRLEDLLAHPVKMVNIVRDELVDLKGTYGDARRTAISDKDDVLTFSERDLIPDQEVVVVVSARDYVKRLPSDPYRARGRAQQSQPIAPSRDDDAVQHLLVARTHHSILFFSNRGRVFQVKAHELPDAGRQARGLPLVNLIKLAEDETITVVLAVPEFDPERYCVLITRAGEIKRIALAELASARPFGLTVIGLGQNDELGWVRLSSGEQEVILASAGGNAIRFAEGEIRASGRGSGGVRAMRLADGDSIAGADVVEPGGHLVLVSELGYVKRVPLDEFSAQGRGGGGVRAMSVSTRTGPLAAARVADLADEMMIVSSGGLIVRTAVESIPRMGRTAQGSPGVALENADRVVALARLRPPESSLNGGVAKDGEAAIANPTHPAAGRTRGKSATRTSGEAKAKRSKGDQAPRASTKPVAGTRASSQSTAKTTPTASPVESADKAGRRASQQAEQRDGGTARKSKSRNPGDGIVPAG